MAIGVNSTSPRRDDPDFRAPKTHRIGQSGYTDGWTNLFRTSQVNPEQERIKITGPKRSKLALGAFLSWTRTAVAT